MTNMIIEGNVATFKPLAFSKIMHLLLLVNTPLTVIKELNNKEKKIAGGVKILK